MSESNRTLAAGAQPLPTSTSPVQPPTDASAAPPKACALMRGVGELPPVPACILGKLSFIALVACPAFIALGLLIYVLPVLLFMFSGGGSMNSFGEMAEGFTAPALISAGIGLGCLALSALGYFAVLFKIKQ